MKSIQINDKKQVTDAAHLKRCSTSRGQNRTVSVNRRDRCTPPRKDAGMSHSFGIRATVGGNCGRFTMDTDRFHLAFSTGTCYFIEDSLRSS